MISAIFWLSLASVFYTYIGYITLCLLLARIFGKKIVTKDATPSVSIIVTCYNEERHIRQKIENLLSLDYLSDKLQILIASESTDKTNEIAATYAERGIQLVPFSQRCGKTKMIFEVAPRAQGEILIFSDANVFLQKDSLKKIVRNFSEDRIGAVIGRVTINNSRVSTASFGENLYKRYESVLRYANGRRRCVLNSDGALFAIRKELYKPLSPERGDDFELIIQVLLEGYQSVFEPEAICSEDASLSAKEEIARKIRMVSWFLKSSKILIARMIQKNRLDLIVQIISHKILRWLTPYFLILIFLSNVFLWNRGNFYKIFLFFQIAGYSLGSAGLYLSEIKKITPPLLLKGMGYFMLYNYAFAIGISKGLFWERKTSAFWETKRS